MPPGKKAEQKRKEKIIEDKTFGLKNKNRSAKVQAYVQQVQKTVNQRNPNDRRAVAEAEERRRAKEDKKAREAELAKLFHDVDQAPRRAKDDADGADAGEGEEGGALVYDPDAYLFRPEDFDAVAHDARRLEERLEAEREALQGRLDLTPVTEATFQAWKRETRLAKTAKEAARVRQAKAGHGALRGWDLWQMDQNLFVDDDQADEFYKREVFNDEDDEEEYDLS
ncbi:unnamed protein product [Phytomonas sp. Hart1]|nr:unnamed protein product [Phytomonas sp. Hart1]|eukprot:CCW71380.1 unnamed protein product [Phytomonas sp. isolate Hart1]